MDAKELKKFLAGFGIASLIAGTSLIAGGCAHTGWGGKKGDAKSGWGGAKSDAQQAPAKGSEGGTK